MQSFRFKSAARLAAAGLFLALAAPAALADIDDFAFRLVEDEVKAGNAAEIAVRLVDTRTGEAVPDAIIISRRLDMAPDGMADMISALTPLPATEPGLYRFEGDLGHAGRWRLTLGAKVQGEEGTLRNELVFRAVP